MTEVCHLTNLFATTVLVELSVCLVEVQVQVVHLAGDLLSLECVLVHHEHHVVDVLLQQNMYHSATLTTDLRIVFLRLNRISNRIGRPIRFRIEFSNRISRIYHASRNTV